MADEVTRCRIVPSVRCRRDCRGRLGCGILWGVWSVWREPLAEDMIFDIGGWERKKV